MADFEEAIERIVAGLEKKSRMLSREGARIVAHHEVGPRAGRASRCRTPTRCTRSRSSRAASPRSGMTYQLPDRGPLPDHPQRAARTASRCCWAAASPRSSSSARSPPARTTTSSAPASWRGSWSPSTGCPSGSGLATYGERDAAVPQGSPAVEAASATTATPPPGRSTRRSAPSSTGTHDRVPGLLTAKKAVLIHGRRRAETRSRRSRVSSSSGSSPASPDRASPRRARAMQLSGGERSSERS